jgi:hypothetical protein
MNRFTAIVPILFSLDYSHAAPTCDLPPNFELADNPCRFNRAMSVYANVH